jgi:diguanylate cyclase (GGDEF)-like protein
MADRPDQPEDQPQAPEANPHANPAAVPMPADELGRQRALERYGVLDSPTDENFQRIVRLTARVMETPTALISLVDGDRQWFLAREGLEASETPRQVAFCAHAICTEEPLVVTDARQDPRFCSNPLVTGPPGIRFYAGAVLQSPEGQNLGTLCVIDRSPRQLSRFQVETLQDLAALALRELELRRLASTCQTTGTTRRDAFLKQAQRELDRCREREQGLALLLLDIDHFNLINQHWGHRAGDQVLAEVAASLRSQLRPADLLGRLGGEEFAMLMVDVDLEEALDRAETLRREIQALRGVYSASGHRLHLSGGLTLRTPGDRRIEDLLRRSEQALLLAQGNGRDQIAEVLGRATGDDPPSPMAPGSRS